MSRPVPVLDDAVIELDRSAPQAARRGGPARRRTRRQLGLLAAVLCVLATGAAAPAPRDRLVEVGAVALPAGADLVPAGPRVYVTAPVTGSTDRTITAYRSGTGDPLWTVRLAASEGDAVAVQRDDAGVLFTRTAIVAPQRGTVALHGDTGATRWSSDLAVSAGSGRYGLATGLAEAFRGTALRGVDLADGRERWRVELPFIATAQWAGPDTILVTSSRTVQLRDAATGAVRHEQRLGAVDGTGWQRAGGLLLARHREPGGLVVTGYAADDLQLRWRRTMPAGMLGVGDCGTVPCLLGDTGRWILDPATGEPGWQVAGARVLGHAGHLVEVAGADRDRLVPRRTRDPRDGGQLIDLAGWDDITEGDGPADPLILTRQEASGGSTIGVLTAGARAVTVLGRSAEPVSGCRAASRVLVCRTAGARLGLWTYPAP